VFNDSRRIPENLSYAPRRNDLALIEQRFFGAQRGHAFEGRYDCRSFQFPPCFGPYEPVETQSTRSDFVSTQAGVNWYQDVFHVDGWEQRHQQAHYAAGDKTRIDWMAPIVRPRLGPGFWGPARDAGYMEVNMPTASGNGVTGAMWEPAGTVVSRLYVGDELLDEQPFQAVWAVDLPDGAATYRFEQDTERGSEPWRTSVRTRSAWTFTSARPPDGVRQSLPLLQLDYAVEADLKGNARRGSNVIGISAGHEDGAVGGGDVLGATLELSFDDGATWSPAALTPAGDGWRASVTYPAGADFVSVRASAWDDAGNRVEQVVIRAFGLS
jgi:hypothetical protein